MSTTVLVAGAADPGAAAVVRRLLEDGAAVRALVADRNAETARDLADRGATLVAGDLSQRDHVVDAADGGGGRGRSATGGPVDGVFAVTPADDATGVLTRGENLAAAVDAADPDLVAYGSVGNADAEPGVPVVDAHRDVEERLLDADAPTLVVRRHLSTRLLDARRDAVRDGRLPFPLEWGARATLTDPADVGRFAARAFADHDRCAGGAVELASAALTLDEMAAAVADVVGRDVSPVYEGIAGAPRGRADFFAWVNEGGLAAGVEPADLEREYGFDPTPLRESLRRRWDA